MFFLVINSVNASPFATIGMTGLSFVNPAAAAVVSNAMCVLGPAGIVTCAAQYVQGKIIGQITGEVFNQIAQASPEAAQAISTYNQIKGYVDTGANILEELCINEDGSITCGKISTEGTDGYLGNKLGFENEEDVYFKNLQIEFGEEANLIEFGKEGKLWLKQGEDMTFFEGIQEGGLIKLDKEGNILEADFTTSDIGTFKIGDNKQLTVSENTRIIYLDGEIYVDEDFVYGGHSIKKPLSEFNNIVRVSGDNVLCTNCVVDDIKLDGWLVIDEKGYLIKKGSVAEKDKIRLTTNDNDVLIANWDSTIDGNWVKISDKILEAQSSINNKINLEVLEGNELFNTKEEDFLSFELNEEGYIHAINRDEELEFPLFRYDSKKKNDVKIINGAKSFIFESYTMYEGLGDYLVGVDSVPLELFYVEEDYLIKGLKIFDENEYESYEFNNNIKVKHTNHGVITSKDLIEFGLKHPLIALKYKTKTPMSPKDKKILLDFAVKKYEGELQYSSKYLDLYLNSKKLKNLPKSEWYGDERTRRQGKKYPVYDVSEDFKEAGLDLEKVLTLSSNIARNKKNILEMYNNNEETVILFDGNRVSPMEKSAMGDFSFYAQKGKDGKAIIRAKDRYDWFSNEARSKRTSWKIKRGISEPNQVESNDNFIYPGSVFEIKDSTLVDVGEAYIMNGEWEVPEELFLRYFSGK